MRVAIDSTIVLKNPRQMGDLLYFLVQNNHFVSVFDIGDNADKVVRDLRNVSINQGDHYNRIDLFSFGTVQEMYMQKVQFCRDNMITLFIDSERSDAEAVQEMAVDTAALTNV